MTGLLKVITFASLYATACAGALLAARCDSDTAARAANEVSHDWTGGGGLKNPHEKLIRSM